MTLVPPSPAASLAVSAAGRAVVGRPEAVELRPLPIDPAWILAGEPRARGGNHSESVDGWASTALWECTAGRFRWHFAWEETVLILEGGVRVTDAEGATTVLRPGDLAYFPAGSWFVWEVDEHVRKIAFCRRPVPRAARAADALRERARALRAALRRLAGR